ncbi:MAG: hypothetical protein SF053_14050 [Bacteroidia bacterium]|jgi:hypothetical protein|nr:hypothetical protein [Bacteroidia bacterium]
MPEVRLYLEWVLPVVYRPFGFFDLGHGRPYVDEQQADIQYQAIVDTWWEPLLTWLEARYAEGSGTMRAFFSIEHHTLAWLRLHREVFLRKLIALVNTGALTPVLIPDDYSLAAPNEVTLADEVNKNRDLLFAWFWTRPSEAILPGGISFAWDGGLTYTLAAVPGLGLTSAWSPGTDPLIRLDNARHLLKMGPPADQAPALVFDLNPMQAEYLARLQHLARAAHACPDPAIRTALAPLFRADMFFWLGPDPRGVYAWPSPFLSPTEAYLTAMHQLEDAWLRLGMDTAADQVFL